MKNNAVSMYYGYEYLLSVELRFKKLNNLKCFEAILFTLNWSQIRHLTEFRHIIHRIFQVISAIKLALPFLHWLFNNWIRTCTTWWYSGARNSSPLYQTSPSKCTNCMPRTGWWRCMIKRLVFSMAIYLERKEKHFKINFQR